MRGFRCKWCHGRGCTFCPAERAKWLEAEEKRRMEPIITARLDDPQEVEEVNSVIGYEALKKAFGPGGGGVQEIEYNAAVVNVVRALRNMTHTEGEPVYVEPQDEPEPPKPPRPPRQEGLFDGDEDDDPEPGDDPNQCPECGDSLNVYGVCPACED